MKFEKYSKTFPKILELNKNIMAKFYQGNQEVKNQFNSGSFIPQKNRRGKVVENVYSSKTFDQIGDGEKFLWLEGDKRDFYTTKNAPTIIVLTNRYSKEQLAEHFFM